MKRLADQYLDMPGSIVSACPIFRAGLGELLDSTLPGIRFRGYEFIPTDLELHDPSEPSIRWSILADTGRPDNPFADWAGVKRLRSVGVAIIALVASLNLPPSRSLADNGVTEILTLNATGPDIAAALKRALEGNSASSRVIRKQGFVTLSQAERLVAKGIAEGDTLKDIANNLGISEKTVSSYKSRIKVKLGAESNAELFRRLEPLVAWISAEESSLDSGVQGAGGGQNVG